MRGGQRDPARHVTTTFTPPRDEAARPLAGRTLDAHAARVAVPTYDRTALLPAVVHIGVGCFHRGHQAVYLDDLAEQGITLDWGVVGVSLRSAPTRDALAPQDWLYTVVERGDERDHARVIGCLTDVLFAPDDPGAVLDALAAPATRLVTLTITGGGYHVDLDTGRLADDPEIAADLADPRRPRTAIGYLVESLDRRRRAGLGPFTVLSCDNVPANGRTTRRAVLAFAQRRDPSLAAWIAAHGAFPSSVVDRITPETTSETRRSVARTFGVDDRAPVITEPFRQWIVEDRFCAGRPPLGAVGVRYVGDVEPYERMKKRLLNGSHSALGYVGYLLGHRDTAGALADPLVRAYVDRVMRDEIVPLLPPAPGIDLHEYCSTLLERFGNRRLNDRLTRLCARGSTKVPAYLLPSISEARRAGRPHELLTLAVAAWVRYLRGVDLEGEAIPIRDPRVDELQRLAERGGDDPAPLMAASRVFGWLAEDPMLVRSVARILAHMSRHGLRPTVEAYLDPRRTGLAA